MGISEFDKVKQSVEQVVKTNNDRINSLQQYFNMGEQLVEAYKDKFMEKFGDEYKSAVKKLEGFNVILLYSISEGDFVPEVEKSKNKQVAFIQGKIEENREFRPEVNKLIDKMMKYMLRNSHLALSLSGLQYHTREFENTISLLNEAQEDNIFPQLIRADMAILEENLKGALLKVDAVLPDSMHSEYMSGILVKVDNESNPETIEKYVAEVQSILLKHEDSFHRAKSLLKDREKYEMQKENQKEKERKHIISTFPSLIEEEALKVISSNAINNSEEASGISSAEALNMVREAVIMVESLKRYNGEWSEEEVAEELIRILNRLQAEI